MRRMLIKPMILFGAVTGVLGGVKIKMESGPVNQVATQASWVYVGDENTLRIDPNVDLKSGKGANMIIYRGDSEALFMVDHESQEYFRLDRETMDALAARLELAMKEMDERIRQLPEGQRQIMEDMVAKNRPGAGGGFTVEVKELGMEDGRHKYEVWIGGEKRSEVWAASSEELGIPANSLDVFKKVSDFYQGLLSTLSSNPMLQSIGGNPFPGFTEMKGFPVRIYDIQENFETKVTEAREEDFPPGFFDVPAGYSRRDFEVE